MPSLLHTDERHTVADAHARLFGSPHRLSPVSHAPLMQTRVPTAAVHVPLIGALLGTACPFGIFAAHVPRPTPPVALSHHCEDEQSASTVQSEPHAPVVMLQIKPAWAPTQSRLVRHFPHEPAAAQYGLFAVGHGAVVDVPLSPLHAAHVLVTHAGVVPVHAVPFVAVQGTHWFVVVLHAGVVPEQVVSLVHASHLPALGPVVAQTPPVHCVLDVQVPSPVFRPQTFPFVSHTPLEHTIAPTPVVHVPAMAGV